MGEPELTWAVRLQDLPAAASAGYRRWDGGHRQPVVGMSGGDLDVAEVDAGEPAQVRRRPQPKNKIIIKNGWNVGEVVVIPPR